MKKLYVIEETEDELFPFLVYKVDDYVGKFRDKESAEKYIKELKRS